MRRKAPSFSLPSSLPFPPPPYLILTAELEKRPYLFRALSYLQIKLKRIGIALHFPTTSPFSLYLLSRTKAQCPLFSTTILPPESPQRRKINDPPPLFPLPPPSLLPFLPRIGAYLSSPFFPPHTFGDGKRMIPVSPLPSLFFPPPPSRLSFKRKHLHVPSRPLPYPILFKTQYATAIGGYFPPFSSSSSSLFPSSVPSVPRNATAALPVIYPPNFSP